MGLGILFENLLQETVDSEVLDWFFADGAAPTSVVHEVQAFYQVFQREAVQVFAVKTFYGSFYSVQVYYVD
jgi:hypothetical protein